MLSLCCTRDVHQEVTLKKPVLLKYLQGSIPQEDKENNKKKFPLTSAKASEELRKWKLFLVRAQELKVLSLIHI